MFEHRPFGQHLRFTVRGASHAPAIDFELDNFPAGLRIDQVALRNLMERRAPGRDALSTARREPDLIEWRTGVRDGFTDGRMISGRIVNSDVRPHDYGGERTVPRPGHADYGQWIEQGRIPTGGGSNSGRLTAAYCAAGGLCLQWLQKRGVRVSASLARVGGQASDFETAISAAKQAGDSVGGVICCQVAGLRPGLGGAMFAGVESELSAALFAIPGVKGVEFGNGFAAADLRGSENNDEFTLENGHPITRTNRHGGVLGGRTTGMPLEFKVAMKPTPTVFKPQSSVDLATREIVDCTMKGRHDPCIVRRALPVVEAITALVLSDMILAAESATPRICLTLTGNSLSQDWQQYLSERPFVDMVELRVDLLTQFDWTDKDKIDEILSFIRKFTLPVIVTLRRKSDGGAFEGPETLRIDFYRRFLSNLGSVPRVLLSNLGSVPRVLVDFELDFQVSELSALAAARDVQIIRSCHIFSGSVPTALGSVPTALGSVPTALGSVPTGEIVKLAVTADNAVQVADYIKNIPLLMDAPHVFCVMGNLGVASRVLAVRTRSLWTYASVSGLKSLGHLSPFELVRDYRLRVQTANFELFGVTGWPLRQTRSPELHNAAFAANDYDAVMVPFPIATAAEVVEVIRTLNLKGMAVTIPHKEQIMPLLDEISPTAQAIGAVNTIDVRNGRLYGDNTDADGFAIALMKFLGSENLSGLKVAVLGAGGAAKAVVFALRRLQAAVEVFHRRPLTPGFSVIVNATPVDPIPEYSFTGKEAVYDLVYVPEITPLMDRAKAAGCRVENGFSMLKAQAELQREIWDRQ